MSILGVCTTNLIANRTSGQIAAPTAATGVLSTDLTEGGLAQYWATSTSSLTHTIEVTLDSLTAVTFASVFAVQSSDAITLCRIQRSSVTPWVNEGDFFDITLNSRGDGWATAATKDTRSIRFGFTVASSTTISVGELWAGVLASTNRAYATLRPSVEYPEIRNESDARSTRVTQIADYVTKLDLGFDRLNDTDRDEMLGYFHAARGGRNPIVLVPNTADSSRVYHGRLGPSMSWSQDYPINDGLAWSFTESGRRLG